jgi:hypothetical protein
MVFLIMYNTITEISPSKFLNLKSSAKIFKCSYVSIKSYMMHSTFKDENNYFVLKLLIDYNGF